MVSPLEQLVNNAKLAEYIFLFNGIILVAGYIASPRITQIITHFFSVLFNESLLSFMTKQKQYPMYVVNIADKFENNPSGSLG